MEMKPVTAFDRFDKESQKWVHNHIEDGHKDKPDIKLIPFIAEQGYLAGAKNTFIAK
jgi:hypothetical protein